MSGSAMSPGGDAAAPFDLMALQRYLQSRVADFDGPLAIARFPGGQSNPTYLLTTPGHRYAVRCKPAPAAQLLPSAHAIEREFRVQSALAGSAVPVARMHCLCEDESVIGRAFYLMDHLEGRVFWQQSLPDMGPRERGAIYDELNRIIAELHRVDFTARGLGNFGKTDNYLNRQIERWTRQYRASETVRIEAMDRLIDWLPRHIPYEAEPLVSLVHGDYRIDNVIFHVNEPRILGVIDWELSTIGHPFADFAYHLMSWRMPPDLMRGLEGLDLPQLGIPAESAYIAAYQRRLGRQVNVDWDFYLAYSMFRLAAIVQGIVKRADQGIASNARAGEQDRLVRPLAELAWESAQRAGKSRDLP